MASLNSLLGLNLQNDAFITNPLCQSDSLCSVEYIKRKKFQTMCDEYGFKSCMNRIFLYHECCSEIKEKKSDSKIRLDSLKHCIHPPKSHEA